MHDKLRPYLVVVVALTAVLLPISFPQALVLVACLAAGVLSAYLPPPIVAAVPGSDPSSTDAALQALQEEVHKLKKQTSDLSFAKAFTKK